MKFPASTVQTSFDSPLGRIILAAAEDKLVGIWFDGQRHQPDTRLWTRVREHLVLQLAQHQLSDYLAGRRSTFELPLDLSLGTLFQQQVWRALLKIPRGATASYGAVSAAIGKPAALRAVGGAVGRNPWSIVVPCHRVIGADGSLTGYAGGLERKTALLQLESQP
ncbi:MAG: methylated-DNA--[protein]-cysteine S-methyltransferase [Rhodoferax sp.]|uniref:methylated-DNA--[protein]-cysteine S-methyltransferase n=1 Tax=Rhodoferax sp. TaxID=50421 RepID=UPI002616C8DD|nr:methylated-DNA--[protein]-cysteine S-methyltransferase [Rhodoferax sp.]MDD5335657.1 methylated-DNA--[protein]-cysteine S-methyltransferase [Rhodoferax sp.]